MEKQKCPEVRFKGFDQNWEALKLFDVALYKNGKSHEADVVEKGTYVIVNSKFVSTNGLVKKFCQNQIEPLYKGDITFVLSDVPNGRALSKTFLIQNDDLYTLNQRIAGLKPKEGFQSDFLQRRINRHPYFLKFDDGVGQTNLSLSDMEEFSSWYPSKDEQTQIGNFFQNLDQSIALQQKKFTQTQNLKKAMLEKMFPKVGSKQPEIRLKGFSGEWFGVKILDFAPLQRGFDLPVDFIEDGNYPVVFSNGILKYHNQYKVKGEGVVTGRSGTIGKVTFVDYDYWPHNTALWVTNFHGNYPKFVYYFYVQFDLLRFSTGSGVPTLNRNDVHSQQVFVPKSIDEQIAIAQFFKQLDQTLILQQQQLQTLKNLKQAFLEKMFV